MVGGRFININTNLISSSTEQDDYSENSPENSSGGTDQSPPRSSASMLNNYDTKISCNNSSPKRSRRSIQKRVVSVPIKDIEGSRLKGEMGAPPSDSWAWRKYGQKPIKGSPYPRGYYRCSSSKGCPARKQVERSRLDPTMLVVTYSCDHNHPWPTPRNNSTNINTATTTCSSASASASAGGGSRRKINNAIRAPPPELTIAEQELLQEEEEDEEKKPTLILKNDDDINGETTATTTTTASLGGGGDDDEYGYLLSELLVQDRVSTDHADVMDDMAAVVFTMREGDDESFFAELDVLPECSKVFRRRRGIFMDREEHQHHRHNKLAPWCGTT